MANFGQHSTKITWATDPKTNQARRTKNCPLPCVRMIGPAGQVVDIATATGRGIPDVRNLYAPQIIAEKLRKGWVRYDSLSDKKREELILERRAKHNEQQEQYAQQTMTEGKLMVEVMRKFTEQNGGSGGVEG